MSATAAVFEMAVTQRSGPERRMANKVFFFWFRRNAFDSSCNANVHHIRPYTFCVSACISLSWCCVRWQDVFSTRNARKTSVAWQTRSAQVSVAWNPTSSNRFHEENCHMLRAISLEQFVGVGKSFGRHSSRISLTVSRQCA